jgi:hypothetical protein
MDFKSWLEKEKVDKPDLSPFITRLELLFSETGFKGAVFERKIDAGLHKIDLEIDELLKPNQGGKD